MGDESKESKARAAVSAVLRSDPQLRAKALKDMGADDETVEMISIINGLITNVEKKHGDAIPTSWGLGCGGIAC